jgi:hypothetical protein
MVLLLFDHLDDDSIIRVLSYLWFHDLYRMGTVSKRYRQLIMNPSTQLSYSLFINFWHLTSNQLITSENKMADCKKLAEVLLSPSIFSQEIVHLCSRYSNWPTEIDTTLLVRNMRDVTALISGQTSACVAYTGRRLGSNRSFVANNHFPIPNVGESFTWKKEAQDEHHMMMLSSFPFTKLVYDSSNGRDCTIPLLSGICYYEITIHPYSPALSSLVMNGSNASNNNNDNENIVLSEVPCVAIGIAHSMSYDKLHAMPGWNDFSFAFHGDDGHFFHRHGQSGKRKKERWIDG